MKYRRQYPCRCRKCGKRRTIVGRRYKCNMGSLTMPDRLPRCGYCGTSNWRVDVFRRFREHQKYACDCKGVEGVYDFKGAPHRRGSKWCRAGDRPIDWVHFAESHPRATMYV